MPQNCRFSSAVTNALTTGAFSGLRKKHLKAKSEQVPPRHTPTGGLGAAAGQPRCLLPFSGYLNRFAGIGLFG